MISVATPQVASAVGRPCHLINHLVAVVFWNLKMLLPRTASGVQRREPNGLMGGKVGEDTQVVPMGLCKSGT